MKTLDNCCKGRERRAVGCHNVNTCEAWAAHEARAEEYRTGVLRKETQVRTYNYERANAYHRSWRGRRRAKEGKG